MVLTLFNHASLQGHSLANSVQQSYALEWDARLITRAYCVPADVHSLDVVNHTVSDFPTFHLHRAISRIFLTACLMQQCNGFDRRFPAQLKNTNFLLLRAFFQVCVCEVMSICLPFVLPT